MQQERAKPKAAAGESLGGSSDCGFPGTAGGAATEPGAQRRPSVLPAPAAQGCAAPEAPGPELSPAGPLRSAARSAAISAASCSQAAMRARSCRCRASSSLRTSGCACGGTAVTGGAAGRAPR